MAKINGSKFILHLDGSAIGSSTSVSLSITNDLPDTTTKDSGGWAEHLAGGGLRGASGSVDGFEDPADTYGLEELFSLLSNPSDFDATIIDVTPGSTLKGFSFKATISDLEVTYEMEQAVGLSFSFQANGEVTRVLSS